MGAITQTNEPETALAFRPKIQRTREFSGVIFFADASGSMGLETPNGETRHQKLVKAIHEIWNTAHAIIQFNDKARIIWDSPDNMIPPQGGTHLCPAFSLAKKYPAKKIIVISDGEVSDEHGAITMSRQSGCSISCIFVGDENNRGAISFLNKLCNDGRGCEILSIDKKMPAELTRVFQKLLA